MAKDPAFLFYPGDWLGGTMYMTHLEKGCYMDLLMLQFNKGKFTLAQAKHMLNTSFDLAWTTVSEKFRHEDGLYWNERLQSEKEKRSKFSESRRSNAKSIKNNSLKTEASAKHMLKHMENENLNEDCKLKEEVKKVIAKKKEKEPPLEFPYESEHFLEAWNLLILCPKWKGKIQHSLQLSLNKLKEFDEEFSIQLIYKAIEANWQGLVYDDTKQKYQDYLNNKKGIKIYKNGTDKKLNITSNCEPGRDFGKL